MATIKISQLPSYAEPVDRTEPFPVVQNGATVQMPIGTVRPFFTVKDFGASGNGSDDDTTAIQNAIDSVGNDGVLYFPPGVYKTTATIQTRYGINSFLFGGSVYCGATIEANHADHIFQYNWTVELRGLSFTRATAYRAQAIADQKNGIHSDDSGGAISGAAYTNIQNCVVGPGSYVGIRMHGTWQMAINNVANECSYGMALYGGVHTLIQNACEDNTISSLLVNGNGHKVLSHYADTNCSSGTALHGAITMQDVDMCLVQGVQFNDNNAAPHFYLDRCKRSWFGNCNFYNTSPRVTLYATGGSNTFSNDFTAIRQPITVTQAGSTGDTYNNYFPFGSSYGGALTEQQRGYNSINSQEHVFEIVTYIPLVATSGVYDGWTGTALATGAQYFGVRGFQGEFANNAELRVLGASITANGAGASKTVDLSLKVRDVYNNTDLATLVTLNADEQYGAAATVDTTAAGIVDIPGWAAAGVKSWWNFYLINNSGAVTADNVVIRITCAYRSAGSYI